MYSMASCKVSCTVQHYWGVSAKLPPSYHKWVLSCPLIISWQQHGFVYTVQVTNSSQLCFLGFISPCWSSWRWITCTVNYCSLWFIGQARCDMHSNSLFLVIRFSLLVKLEVNCVHSNLLVRAKGIVMNEPWLLSNPLCVLIIKARYRIDINTTSNWTTCFWYLVITYLAWL